MENGIIFILICLALYLLPGIVASSRRHHNLNAIWILNILLGWTFIGWVGALVWACTSPPPQRSA